VRHDEKVLYAHLTNPDSLDVLAREGFTSEVNREVIPTELGREIVKWALDKYYESGRTVAPSREAIETTWDKDEMEKLDVSIDDDTETDSVEWAIETLRSHFAWRQTNIFVKEFAQEVKEAPAPDKVAVIRDRAGQLHALAQVLTSHRNEAPADVGLQDAYERLQARAAQSQTVSGMTLGVREVDEHTMGTHAGEMAVFAAFSGVGKSWIAAKTCFTEWKRGRQTILYTLENDLEMTFDRMACMQARIPYELWQKGKLDAEHVQRIEMVIDEIKATEHAPMVIMPGRGDRTAVSMVRKAFSLGAKSIILDQLSFVERNPGSRARQRNEVFAENIGEIKALISEGREKIPALVLHQINREGAKEARKTNRYVLTDLAESSEVERVADFVFSAYQSKEDFSQQQAVFQMLKARRTEKKSWQVSWRLDVGDIRVVRELVDE
jgi:replicative DNA helicase